MLFNGLNLTPKGRQLAELKGMENIHVGRIIINTSDQLADLSDPATLATKANAADLSDPATLATKANADGLSVMFAGWHCIRGGVQLNVRFQVNGEKTNDGNGNAAMSVLNTATTPLRLAVLADDEIIASENVETGEVSYRVIRKKDATVLGWADVAEKAAWTTESPSGIVFDAVITAKGELPSRCNVKDVLRCPYLSNTQISNDDICNHDLAPSSISPRNPEKENDVPVAEAKQQPRVEPESGEEEGAGEGGEGGEG